MMKRAAYVAFGLAGLKDRPLLEEVAKMEISLVRHGLHLRRLVLRYLKAFLLFIFTSLVLLAASSSAGLSGITSKGPEAWQMAVLFFAFCVLGYVAPLLIRWPIRWIAALAPASHDHDPMQWDDHIVDFERMVTYVACFMAVLATPSFGYYSIVWLAENPHPFWGCSIGLAVSLLYFLYWIKRMRSHISILKGTSFSSG
jgi:hypothetical protein